MPDDFDSVVADRFKLLDELTVPDTWSLVESKVVDGRPVQFTEEDATMIDLEAPVPTDDRENRHRGFVVAGLMAAAAAVVVVAGFAVWTSSDPELITPADTVVTSSTEPAAPPLDAAPVCEPQRCPWSPEFAAQVVELPAVGPSPSCFSSPNCAYLAVSPDGTLVAYRTSDHTLTWYEDEPRVVQITADLLRFELVAIGPHDVAYFATAEWVETVAVAPSGAEITRVDWPSRFDMPAYATAAGLHADAEPGWPTVTPVLVMPWVDLDGNPISDPRPYPTAKATPDGTEIRLGEREWLIEEVVRDPEDVLVRSDGGVVLVLHTFGEEARPTNLLELSPDGSIGRYFVEPRPTVLLDGSLIVEYRGQLIQLTPPG